MLDYRAWIAVSLILLSGLGAYVIWVIRPRSVMPARSLSAVEQSANPATPPVKSTLHVDGCNDDFVVKAGELVQPKVAPGASVEQFRSEYGKETKRAERGVLTWDRNAYSLSERYSEAGKLANIVHVSLKQGHVLETLDGIELGIDSFGAIFRKMRDRAVEVHERIDAGNGKWTLTVSFYSTCGRRFRSEYSRTIDGSAELDHLIAKRSTELAPTPMWRSDVFMNKIVSEYTLVTSNGQDDSEKGSPSTHF